MNIVLVLAVFLVTMLTLLSLVALVRRRWGASKFIKLVLVTAIFLQMTFLAALLLTMFELLTPGSVAVVDAARGQPSPWASDGSAHARLTPAAAPKKARLTGRLDLPQGTAVNPCRHPWQSC